MGIKLARALGAHVVAFTTSESKRDDAFKLGAHEVVVSRNADEMAAQANSLDFIINTVAAPHDLDAYLGLLKRDGTMTLVGITDEPHPSPSVASLIGMRRSLAGSLIGESRKPRKCSISAPSTASCRKSKRCLCRISTPHSHVCRKATLNTAS